MKTVTTRIPEEDEKLLEKIQEKEKTGRSEALRRLIEKGIDDWRRERALELLEDHKVTLRKATDLAGVSYVEMLELASEEGIESGYDLEDLERDMERI